MKPRIFVENRQRKLKVRVAPLQRFAHAAMAEVCGLKTPGGVLHQLARVRVLLISDRRIAELHRRFMNIAGPTDVITFEHGEVFISTETAKRQARDCGTSLHDELELYVLHGLLHLRGFDDRTAAAAREMERVQHRLLARLHEG